MTAAEPGLEEALAECVLWITQQDIFDDQFDEATKWTGRLDEVEAVRALVARADAALALPTSKI